eukprot:COSAG05_NODE_1254_length_5375_cov_10.078658_4_plen_130_part_00
MQGASLGHGRSFILRWASPEGLRELEREARDVCLSGSTFPHPATEPHGFRTDRAGIPRVVRYPRRGAQNGERRHRSRVVRAIRSAPERIEAEIPSDVAGVDSISRDSNFIQRSAITIRHANVQVAAADD